MSRKLYEQYIEREQFGAHQTKQPNSLEESPEKRTSPDENGNDDGENVRNVELEHRLSVSDLVDKMNTLSVAKDKDWKKNKRRAVFVTNEMEKELHEDMHDTSPNKTNSQDLLIKECKIIDSDKKNNNVVSLNTMHTRSNSLGNENKDKIQTTTTSKRLKGSLKKCNDSKGKMPLRRRVSFDPLALLLDASLEGELELVKKTSAEVKLDCFQVCKYNCCCSLRYSIQVLAMTRESLPCTMQLVPRILRSSSISLRLDAM